ncbi:MAG: Na+/H+ antiporter NhaA [Nocardioidaceae bacterium]
MSDQHRRMFPAQTEHEERFLGQLLRRETVGGALVLVAALVALVWANSPVSNSYESLLHLRIGPLDVEHWAADGALTLFFYVAGLELKRELVVGSLRNLSDAIVPIVAAVCGVALPALIFVAVNLGNGTTRGWAVPAATDIAFALAVLAVVGSSLPSQLRAFLLTLAVVDDLIVIAIIAVFYSGELHLLWLLGALPLLAVFLVLQRYRGKSWLWYVPIAIALWWCFHESGVHATISGVVLGLLTRVTTYDGEDQSPAEQLEHTLQPWSAGLAVPFFALISAGLPITGGSELIRDPVALGVFFGLFIGKPLGVLGGVWLATRLRGVTLNEGLTWRDLVGVAIIAGIGFTVSLLVADLAYDGVEVDAAKAAVLAGSVASAVLGGLVLHRRSQTYVD